MESRDYSFFLCSVLNLLDEGAVLDIPGSLELRPFADFVSGFRDVGSRSANAYTSRGDSSAGTGSSPRGNVCPSAGSRAGRGFASCVEKGRALQRLSVEKQPCPALGRLGCVLQEAVSVRGPPTIGLLAPLGSKELLLRLLLSLRPCRVQGSLEGRGVFDLLHEK